MVAITKYLQYLNGTFRPPFTLIPSYTPPRSLMYFSGGTRMSTARVMLGSLSGLRPALRMELGATVRRVILAELPLPPSAGGTCDRPFCQPLLASPLVYLSCYPFIHSSTPWPYLYLHIFSHCCEL